VAQKKKNITIKMGLDGWVMTYGDMMSLLLTFFVLIVSFSSMQQTKFEQAAASLADAFGVLNNPESVIELNKPIVPNHQPTDEEAEALYEVRSVEKYLVENGMDQDVSVEVTPEGVLFRVDAMFAFEPASADLKPKSEKLLGRLGRFFRKFPYDVRVAGHTDSVPISSRRYPTNWELSATRAVTVARYFQGVGIQPQKDVPKLDQLPFAKPLVTQPAADQKMDSETQGRPIINPVTSRLGTLIEPEKESKDQ